MSPGPRRRSSEREREMTNDRVSRAIGAVFLIAAPFVGGMTAFYRNPQYAAPDVEIMGTVETPAASAPMVPGNPGGLDLYGDVSPSSIIPQEYRGIDFSPYDGGLGPGTDGRNGYRNGLSPRGQLEDANRKLGTPSK
jgi:hypothetical protein